MDNNGMTATANKPIFTASNVLKVLSLLALIFCFCPSFLVSCSGQVMKINVMTGIGGLRANGEKLANGNPLMVLVLLIPIAIFTLMFIKQLGSQKNAIIVLACSAVDLILWFIFAARVKKLAEESYCTCKSTVWFVFNILVLILMILISGLAAAKIIDLEADLIATFSGGGAANVMNQVSSAMGEMTKSVSQAVSGGKPGAADAMGFCPKCGSPVPYGCKFCESCGNPVPESMIAEAEAKRTAEEQARQAAAAAAAQTQSAGFCKNCGAALKPGAAFCESCGTKVE